MILNGFEKVVENGIFAHNEQMLINTWLLHNVFIGYYLRSVTKWICGVTS